MSDWEDFIKTVKPLNSKEKSSNYDNQANEEHQNYTPPPVNKPLFLKDIASPIEKPKFTDKFFPSLRKNFAPSDKQLELGQNKGQIDAKLASKIKRGKISADATLDLHGLSEAQAFEEVRQFILSNFYAGNRMLIIITGKGDKSKGTGVIRQAFSKFINHPQIAPAILYFTNATIADGGKGAFYVYLRRS